MTCAPCFVYSFVARLVAYFAVLALLAIMGCVILKCIGEWSERNGGEDESSPLVSQCYVSKTVTFSYGTCQQDIETGNCSSSSNSSEISNNSGKKSSEDLYDPKLCIICYDQTRNCFFVPCGHCATCLDCAQRIFFKENKNCPVCRRLISKIRRLFNSKLDN